MNNCFLALGSNLNRPQYQLRRAIATLRKLPRTAVIKVADFYANEAWGRKTQPGFYNTVIQICTSLTPYSLLKHCQQIEINQGRIRRVKWGARTLDIDILLYEQRKLKSPSLKIPHPEILQRDFVLIPLIEIAPNLALSKPS